MPNPMKRPKRQRPSRFDPRILYVVGALVLLIGLIILATKFSKSPIVATTEESVAPRILDGIPPEGTGGDPDLNRQKNRASLPKKLDEYDVDQIIALRHNLLDPQGRKHRTEFSGESQKYLESMESIGARLTGYLIYAKESGLESCNGRIDSLRDYHIWIGATPTADKQHSVVVEMTPRWKRIHPEWRLRYLERLALDHPQVRVSGWLLWDEEHASEVGRSRGSQWEVHPVTSFEVFTNNLWRTLSSDRAS